MPVLLESYNPGSMKSHHVSTNGSMNNTTYILISFAVVLVLGLRAMQQRRKLQAITRKTSMSKKEITAAQTMQGTSVSALPEKPYLPDLESASHVMDIEPATSNIESNDAKSTTLATGNTAASPGQASVQSTWNTSQRKPTHSRPLSPLTSQSLFSPPRVGTTQNRTGSLNSPITTSSLLYPGPPSPTIALNLAPLKIHTQIPFQAKEYQFDEQSYGGQYVQNDILFVPSPTEYTSFEALYSKYPPPIYHDAPNPTSYTSFTSPETDISDTSSQHLSSYSSTDGSPDYQLGTVFPRRKSYTKTLSNGSSVSGEIVISGSRSESGKMGGQWRRHTKVFGGGVCVACEESENKRLSS